MVTAVELADIADRYGTPAYVYDLTEVEAARHRLGAALPGDSRLYYSLKANPHPAVVARLADLGCGAEVSSPAELAAARSAGMPPDRCLYTGPAKTADELEYALTRGVSWCNAESQTDLMRIAEVAAKVGSPADVAVRINPPWTGAGATLAMAGASGQFGIDLDQIVAAGTGLLPAGIRTVGGQAFLGSGIGDPAGLLAAWEVAADALVRLADAVGRPLALASLGGGFPAPYAAPGDPADLAPVRAPLAALTGRLGAHPLLGDAVIAFESGRALTATAGCLLTRVVDVKRSGGRRIVLADSGIHHLGGMQGLRRLRSLNATVVGGGGRSGPAMLAGPLCTPLDRWVDNHDVPEVVPGDLLRVPNVGAYGLTASLLAFLSRETPLEIVVADGEVVEVSRLVLDRRSASEEPK